jgi:hypothetical protein
MAFAVTASAQRGTTDPEIKNYKLSMEKVRAFDSVFHKLMAAAKGTPELKEQLNASHDRKTLNEMVAAIDGIPKAVAVIKAGGLSTREFCLIPLGIMAAGGAYMIQTQYKKDASNLASPENIAFYGANKAEIEKITATWRDNEEQ